MEKSKPVSLYNVYLYCDKCGGLMKEINSSVGAATHSLGYDYRCEQCGDTVVSYTRYPYVKYEERKMKLINHKYLKEIDVIPVQQLRRQGSYKANDFSILFARFFRTRVARYPRLISRRI